MASGYRKKIKRKKRRLTTGQLAVKLLKRILSPFPPAWRFTVNFIKYIVSLGRKAASAFLAFILRFLIYPLLRFAKKVPIKLKQWRQTYNKKWKGMFQAWTRAAFSSIKDYAVILLLYGFLVNYIFWFFLGMTFNIWSVIAFGLTVYFIKYELVSLIVVIRGPKGNSGGVNK